MQTYLTYTAALVTGAFSLDLEAQTYRISCMWDWDNRYDVPQEGVDKLRTFEKYARNFKPIEKALENYDFGKP